MVPGRRPSAPPRTRAVGSAPGRARPAARTGSPPPRRSRSGTSARRTRRCRGRRYGGGGLRPVPLAPGRSACRDPLHLPRAAGLDVPFDEVGPAQRQPRAPPMARMAVPRHGVRRSAPIRPTMLSSACRRRALRRHEAVDGHDPAVVVEAHHRLQQRQPAVAVDRLRLPRDHTGRSRSPRRSGGGPRGGAVPRGPTSPFALTAIAGCVP